MTREQRRRIDAELREHPPEGPRTVEQSRADYVTFMATMQVPSDISTRQTELGGFRTMVVDPTTHTRPGTILFFHGGGWVIGSPETELSLAAQLAVRTGFRVFSPDYRLAPEHPFPAGVHDAFAVYRALLDAGVDPAALALAGDSAGGGLAITTALQARDAGLPSPAAVVAFSPGLDSTRSGESIRTKVDLDPIFTPESLAVTGGMHRGDADPTQPLLSPAVSADLTGFPPVLLQVGTNELLLDDSTRFATRARDAGVSVILDVTADVPHVFQIYAGRLDEADEALDRAGFFLSQRIG